MTGPFGKSGSRGFRSKTTYEYSSGQAKSALPGGNTGLGALLQCAHLLILPAGQGTLIQRGDAPL
jgi:hypothetical protein